MSDEINDEMKAKADAAFAQMSAALDEGIEAVSTLVTDNAVAHGFRTRDWPMTRENVSVFLLNIHGEVSELWEAFRDGKLSERCNKSAKLEALNLAALTCQEEEIADILIRTLDTANAMGIDVRRAVATKHAYNVTRPHLHGNKLA